jgi:hypothetical protein
VSEKQRAIDPGGSEKRRVEERAREKEKPEGEQIQTVSVWLRCPEVQHVMHHGGMHV